MNTSEQGNQKDNTQKVIIAILFIAILGGMGFASYKFLGKTKKQSTAKLERSQTTEQVKVAYTPSILLLSIMTESTKNFGEYRKRGFVARARSDLRNAAVSQEAYFVDEERYVSCSDKACEDILPGLTLSNGTRLEMTAYGESFKATAWHEKFPNTKLYWDSNNGGLQNSGDEIAAYSPPPSIGFGQVSKPFSETKIIESNSFSGSIMEDITGE